MLIEYQFVDPEYIVTICQESSEQIQEPWTVTQLTLNMAQMRIHATKPFKPVRSSAHSVLARWTVPMRSDEMLCVSHGEPLQPGRAAILLRARGGSLEVIRTDGRYFKNGAWFEMTSVKPQRISRAKLVSPAGKRPRKVKENEEFDDE